MRAPDHTLTPPSHCCGVYHLVRAGRVLYVGQSENLMLRIGSHDYQGYDEVRFFYCGPGELNELERAHIEALLPPLNREGITREYRGVKDRRPGWGRLITAADRLRQARREVRAIQGEAA